MDFQHGHPRGMAVCFDSPKYLLPSAYFISVSLAFSEEGDAMLLVRGRAWLDALWLSPLPLLWSCGMWQDSHPFLDLLAL